ncbi:Oligopeptide transport ATP-binding protein OppF (TC 3.A.1.5.1) [Alloactinosynnema sp. L-07]|nr:hypothetical protein [Alloactinosynnema sp. L-07]CRK58212.1 Oligopeptide transport ATP-binding protein OppF (TC 3.A.1.5.1) [Alloactinosynnema sp. L-07]
MTALLTIGDLAVAFGARRVVEGLDLTVDSGESTALVGESLRGEEGTG